MFSFLHHDLPSEKTLNDAIEKDSFWKPYVNVSLVWVRPTNSLSKALHFFLKADLKNEKVWCPHQYDESAKNENVHLLLPYFDIPTQLSL